MKGLKDSIKRSKAEALKQLATLPRKKQGMVDVEKIAQNLGITVKRASFGEENIAGFMRRVNDQGQIFINSNESPRRQRFTLAHELGHFLLHSILTIHVDGKSTASPIYFRDDESSKATRIKEIEANQFAAELLMPTHEINREALKLLTKGFSLEETAVALAEQYEVSDAAMLVKLGVTSFQQ